MSMPEDEKPEVDAASELDQNETPEGGAESAGSSDEDRTEIPEADDPESTITDLKDRLLRTMADMENLRNRSRREQEDALKYATTNFARDLLNVSDNLRRALESVPADADPENETLKTLRDGIEMTERELLSVFERHGIASINPVGEKFDHNAHQAMFKVPGTDAAPGTVVQVVQAGYMLRDRLLRPAMVGVAAENETATGEDGPNSAGPSSEGVDTEA